MLHGQRNGVDWSVPAAAAAAAAVVVVAAATMTAAWAAAKL